MSLVTEDDQKELDNRFTYHAPTGDQPKRYEALRALARAFATGVVVMCPDGREKSLAMTKIEEGVMWANASIARGE